MVRIYLKLFGGVSLLVDGQPYGGRAAHRHRLALLALLAAHEGITRDKLLGFLWPESTMERARNSLSESLYVLRKAFGQEIVIATGEELRLNRELADVDLWDFLNAQAAGELERAAELYRGAFMDGFFLNDAPELDDWIAAMRSRIAAEHCAVLQQLTAAAGNGDEQARWATQWVAAAPSDANATLALMFALARRGNAAAALTQAQRYSTLLAEHFDTEPDARVATLATRIRNGDVEAERTLPAYVPGKTEQLMQTVRNRWPRARWLAPVLGAGVVIVAAAGLYRISRSGPNNDVVTLAVLPFQLGTRQADQQFLSVGMADAIITRLSEHANLRVRPTSTILPYASGAADVKRAARDLDVDYLMTGYVQRLPDALEVRLQLIAAREAAVRWGRTYRIPASQLSTLQDSIAADLSNEIPLERAAAPHGPVRIDATAFETYMRARALLAQHREAEVREAADLFEQAIARAPGFAPAHAGLAIASAEMNLRFASAADASTWGERAVSSAQRALQLDSTLAEVHQALAAVNRKTEFDWAATIRESRKAIALNPNLSTPYFYIGGAYYHLGLLNEGRAAVREGMRKQPQVDRVEALRTLGTLELASGNYARAITLLQDVQRHSDRPVADPHLAAAYYYNGDVARARGLLESLLHTSSASAQTRARALLASIVAAAGQRDSARVLLSQAMRGVIDHHVAYSIATTYAQLGQPAEAVKWLQTAVDTGFQTYPWFERDPLLAPLRADPAFRKFMRGFKRTWQDSRKYAVNPGN